MINNIENFKKLYENANEEMPEIVDVVDETEEMEEDNKLTFDKFKELITDVVEDEMSDDTLMIIFNVVEKLIKEEAAKLEAEEGAEEAIDEGFKDIVNFFKGGTDEEIEKNKKEITDKLTNIYNQYNGKMDIKFNVKGDDKTSVFVLADALKRIGKNNYLGTIISGERNGKIYISYIPGKKGMNKLAGGTNGSISTNR